MTELVPMVVVGRIIGYAAVLVAFGLWLRSSPKHSRAWLLAGSPSAMMGWASASAHWSSALAGRLVLSCPYLAA